MYVCIVYMYRHMVPLDQPESSLDMVNRFITGKPFTAAETSIIIQSLE